MSNYNDELLREAIRASNRTTRAVRSIAILFLYMVPFEIVAGLIYALSTIAVGTDPVNNWQALGYGAFFAILVLVGGLIFTITAAYRELLKSRVLDSLGARASGRNDFAEDISFRSGMEDPSNKSFSRGDALHNMRSRALTAKERELWAAAGSPDLSDWDGSIKFAIWLKAQEDRQQ